VHSPNITRFSRSQDWRATERQLHDALRRLGTQIRHSIGNGCDYAVAEFFDDSTGQLLQVKYVFNLETLARLLADDG
jgi:hypothetical protein